MRTRGNCDAACVALTLHNDIAMTFQTVGPALIAADVSQVHQELAERDSSATVLGDIALLRPLYDITFDWVIIILAVACVCRFGFAVAFPALFAIANRQRALGNLLHEASHRNLYRAPRFNDFVGRALLAPALLVDLDLYRATHARHHAMLGMPAHDPDYIAPATAHFPAWWHTYLRLLFSVKGWLTSVLGHLFARNISTQRRLILIAWWIALWASLVLVTGVRYAGTFVASWYIAKATGFHAITVLREMCDHYGLRPGGIYSFTRDIVVRRRWRWLIHPHNNGYHLTHHLMPAVPYYRLHAAWETVSRLPSYRAGGIACKAYFRGRKSVVYLTKNAGADNSR